MKTVTEIFTPGESGHPHYRTARVEHDAERNVWCLQYGDQKPRIVGSDEAELCIRFHRNQGFIVKETTEGSSTIR